MSFAPLIAILASGCLIAVPDFNDPFEPDRDEGG